MASEAAYQSHHAVIVIIIIIIVADQWSEEDLSASYKSPQMPSQTQNCKNIRTPTQHPPTFLLPSVEMLHCLQNVELDQARGVDTDKRPCLYFWPCLYRIQRIKQFATQVMEALEHTCTECTVSDSFVIAFQRCWLSIYLFRPSATKLGRPYGPPSRLTPSLGWTPPPTGWPSLVQHCIVTRDHVMDGRGAQAFTLWSLPSVSAS